MGIYEELQARGTDRPGDGMKRGSEIFVNNGKAVFYIGFDPTADSLHVGHFMALCPDETTSGSGQQADRTDRRRNRLYRRSFRKDGYAQHDDSGNRSSTNCDCFKKQMSKFIDFSEGKALMVNNADWLLDLNYIEVLREVGPHFSVNRMLTAECYSRALREQDAHGRVLQAENGERIKLP